jgi:CDP-paratose 2-epimerase
MGTGRALITGGAGFIGTNLAHRLLELGREVVILDNLSRDGVDTNMDWLRREWGSQVRVQLADIRDAHAVRRALIDVSDVFHFAAQVAVTSSLDDPLEDFDVNARGTLTLLEAIRHRSDPPRLLFTSTNKVYGDLHAVGLACDTTRYVPIDPSIAAHGVNEDRPVAFHSPYGCSKGAADQYVLDYAHTFGLPAVVFRMSCIYGPHQFGTEDQGWVAHFLLRILRGQQVTVYGDGRQVRDILFVGDLIDAMLAAREALPAIAGQAFNIGGGPSNTISLVELMEQAALLTGRRPACQFAPWRAADQRFYVSNTHKFEAQTGWRPAVSVADGLSKLLSWLEEHRVAASDLVASTTHQFARTAAS